MKTLLEMDDVRQMTEDEAKILLSCMMLEKDRGME